MLNYYYYYYFMLYLYVILVFPELPPNSNYKHSLFFFYLLGKLNDRLCVLVVRVSGHRYRGPGFDPRRYQIF